jgi:5-methyltetrahydrofolate--homocysteine methyltransferase
MAFDAGARIIGGCCGTSPQHLAAMHQALLTHTRQASPSLEQIESQLGDVSTGAKAQWAGQQSREAGAAPGANLQRGSGRRRSAAGADKPTPSA